MHKSAYDNHINGAQSDETFELIYEQAIYERGEYHTQPAISTDKNEIVDTLRKYI
jgi:hypothetical protein